MTSLDQGLTLLPEYMDFGDAIRALKAGERVAREGWNGKGMFLLYVEQDAENHLIGVKLLPWIGMKTACDHFVPWLASQTDMLASDWLVVS